MARSALDERAEALLEGPVWRAMVTLSVPIVLANVLQTVYQLTDTFWLGRVGPAAVAAVSLSFPILFLTLSIGGGLSIAGGILVAQSYGARDTRGVDHFTAQTFVSVGGLSVLLSAAGYYLTPAMVGLLGAESEVAVPATDYLRISFLGLAFQFLYLVFQTTLRSVGDVRTPFYIVLLTVTLNFFLDPLFILGWGPVPAMETAGAAIATVGTQALAAFVGIGLLLRGKMGVHLRMSSMAPDIPIIRQMLRTGIPASLEQSTRAAGMAMMAVLVAGFGTAVLAAYGIGARVLSFVIIPVLGFSMATSTLVSQAVGAGKLDRANDVATTGSRVSFVSLLGLGCILFIFADHLTSVFLPDAPAEAGMAARFVRILALSFGFTGVQQVLAGAFRGAGDTVAAMLLAILALWVLRFPLAFLLSHRTGLGHEGIWWAFPVSEVVAAVFAWLWFRTGRWRRVSPLTPEQRVEQLVVEEAILEEGIES